MLKPWALLLLLSSLLLISAGDSRKRGAGSRLRPYEASCPHGCRCTSRVLDCRNSRITKEDLETVRPEAFVELDTIDFYNAELGDIEYGLFPDDVVHPSVTKVNLTKSGITRISARTFASVPQTEFLDLSDNQIEYAGKSTFSQLEKVKQVVLKNGLARRASQADLLAQMFDFQGNGLNNLVHLSDINLDNNGLKAIHPSTFCKVRGLLRLQLANNQLASFDVESRCMPTLKSLDLSGNNFTTISPSLWDHMGSVTTMDISNNPVICDCSLQPILKVLRDEVNDFANQGLTTCAGPEPMKGKNIFEIQVDLCKTGGYGFGTFLILVLVAAAVLFAYRHYRRRMNRNKVPFEFAYSGLDADDDVQPEFV